MISIVSYACIAVVAVVGGVTIYNSLTKDMLDRYLLRIQRDAKTGIIKGAEPIYLAGQSRKAALLVHGFIGSPTDYGRLPLLLNEKGYTVWVPLLPGHGTNPRDFAQTTPGELETFVLNAYRKMKNEFDEVVLIGFSMGGALSILTAVQEKVDKLILLAPYFKIAHQWYYILPAEVYNKLFLRFIPYVYRPVMFKQINNKAAIAHAIDYDFVSLKGADTAIKLGWKALSVAPGLKQSMLVIHACGDRATNYRASYKFVQEMKKKSDCRFVSLHKSNHMIMLDYDSAEVEHEVLSFVDKKEELR